MIERKEVNGIRWYESTLLQSAGIRHGFGCKDVAPADYLHALQMSGTVVPTTRQVHGATVHRCDTVVPDVLLVGDAFCCRTAGVLLHVRTADCLPLLWWAPTQNVIGAIHAGWRGLATGVISAALRTAAAYYDIAPSDFRVVIGPAMGPDCYEVGREVIVALEQRDHDFRRAARPSRDGRWLLDLSGCALAELVQCGVPRAAIEVIDVCTHCAAHEFHSYRRAPEVDGRQPAMIVRSF